MQRKTNDGSETALPLVHEPGEKWTYGASTKVLGDLVEKFSGERIDVFTDAHIAEPLGMADTFYEVPDGEVRTRGDDEQQGCGRQDHRTANPATLPVSLRGDGGLFSTAPDYGKFLQMLLNGGQLGSARILKASTVADMLKPHTNGVRVRPQPVANTGLSKPYPLGAGEDIWGLGFQLADPKKAGSEHAPSGQRQLGRHLQHVLLDRSEGRAGRDRDDADAAVLRRGRDRDAAGCGATACIRT